MNSYTIPAPGPGQETIFTNADWNAHGNPPILILEEGWIAIGEDAFANGIQLLMIRIPASVLAIISYAFSGAINLDLVAFAEGSRLEIIGTQAFHNTQSLKRIRIPASVINITSAFEGATGLEKVIFEEGSRLEIIGNNAFYGANSLQTIQIPASVTTIRNMAFRAAIKLVKVDFDNLSDCILSLHLE